MCLKVKERCEPLLHQINFKWPQVLDCTNLPDKHSVGGMCIEPPGSYDAEPDHESHFNQLINHPNTHNKEYSEFPNYEKNIALEEYEDVGDYIEIGNNPSHPNDAINRMPVGMQKNNLLKILDVLKNARQPTPPPKINSHLSGISKNHKNQESMFKLDEADIRCPPRYVYVGQFIDRRGNESCVARCDVDVMYKKTDKNFAEVWMLIWAVFCFASTLLTFFTYAIKPSRFQYPQKPIIFLSCCCFMVSCGYILRVIIGSSAISCEALRPGVKFIIQEGVGNTWCIVVFLILYYFGMAGLIWWVNLTISFYLSSARQWSSEAIESKSNFFHIASWTIPAIKTIIILTLRKVDGDELTGTCYVGNQDTRSMIFFVLLPLLAYLTVGIIFILTGFIAMFRIRRDLKGEGTNVSKFDRLMVKIGTFSFLYTAPVSCVIGCLIYSNMNHSIWKHRSLLTPCRYLDSTPNAVDCSLEKSIPNVGVHMLRIFMLLIIGTASGIWSWSPKTLQTWKHFFSSYAFKSQKTNILMSETDTKQNSFGNYNKEKNMIDFNKLSTSNNTNESTFSRPTSSDAIYQVPTFDD